MYQIYNEDCLEGMKKIPAGSVDMILTDPPYCVGATSNGIKGGYSDFLLLRPFFRQLFSEWLRVLKDSAYIYVNTDWRTYPFLYPIMLEYFEVRNLIVWDKDWINASCWYRFKYELIIFATKGKSQRQFSSATPDIWKFRKVAPTDKRNHPSEKPVELLEKMILDGSKEGDTVLDCFAGSGSTGVAAMNTGRKFIGFETEKKFFDIAEKRISEALALKQQELPIAAE